MVDVRFDFHELAASDLMARARSFQSLTDEKLSAEAAARLAGFTEH